MPRPNVPPVEIGCRLPGSLRRGPPLGPGARVGLVSLARARVVPWSVSGARCLALGPVWGAASSPPLSSLLASSWALGPRGGRTARTNGWQRKRTALIEKL